VRFVPAAGLSVGDDLVLRQAADGDVPELAPAFLDPDVGGEAGLPRIGEEELRAFVREQLPGMVASGQMIPIVIRDRESGELLGGALFQRLDPFRMKVELGYWLYAQARGRGVATRVVRAMATHAFEQGMARVEAVVRIGNVPSERVLERAGFAREGVLRSYLLHDGVRCDATMFSLLEADA